MMISPEKNPEVIGLGGKIFQSPSGENCFRSLHQPNLRASPWHMYSLTLWRLMRTIVNFTSCFILVSFMHCTLFILPLFHSCHFCSSHVNYLISLLGIYTPIFLQLPVGLSKLCLQTSAPVFHCSFVSTVYDLSFLFYFIFLDFCLGEFCARYSFSLKVFAFVAWCMSIVQLPDCLCYSFCE